MFFGYNVYAPPGQTDRQIEALSSQIVCPSVRSSVRSSVTKRVNTMF